MTEGSDEILALNELTGRVHQYGGTALGGLGAEEQDMPIGLVDCGCDEFRDAVEHDTLTVIRRRHLEAGIWEPAPCLEGGDDD